MCYLEGLAAFAAKIFKEYCFPDAPLDPGRAQRLFLATFSRLLPPSVPAPLSHSVSVCLWAPRLC